VVTETQMIGMTTIRATRADRMAMPLAGDVLRDVAVENGACIRPIQLRRTDRDTGQTEAVLVPCGSTLESVCPPCAERAKTLRAAQCREGWHLEDEPGIQPDPATEDQRWWITLRAEVQRDRDQAASAGQDTADFDEFIGELDAEITKSGVRGKAAPARTSRRHRSTRRRQDAPDLPKRPVSAPDHRQDLHRAGRQDLPSVPVRHADLPVLRPGPGGRHARRPAGIRL
jgi:replication initiator protein RepSA